MPRYVWGAAFAHKTGNFPPYISSDIGIATPVSGSKVIICLPLSATTALVASSRIASAE